MRKTLLIAVVVVTILGGCRKNSAPESDQILCAFDGKAFAYFVPRWDQAGQLVRVPDADDMCLPIKIRPNAEAVG